MSEDLIDRLICAQCIGDDYLSARVFAEGSMAKCDYCDREEKSVRLDDLTDRINAAFDRHFHRTPIEADGYERALHNDRESSFEWERRGDPAIDVIADTAGVAYEVAKDILELLSDKHFDFDMAAASIETEFSHDAHYARSSIGDSDLHYGWIDIEADLKLRSRFFNASAKSFLDRIFAGLPDRRTADGRPVIMAVGPSHPIDAFYRARYFEDEKALHQAMERPDLHLGPPPSHLARPGRMNAQGISVFYGSDAEAAALAEIRPPVGSRVLTARFALLREARLLDLEALAAMLVAGSVFDPAYADRLASAKFLERLVQKMTMPVTPSVETSEYIVTQVIADYLAGLEDANLDGILFPSVQRRDEKLRNVVMFHHAAKVRTRELANGTSIEARTYVPYHPDEDIEYQVTEYRSGDGDADGPGAEVDEFGFSEAAPPAPASAVGGARAATLEVDLQSLVVHYIEAVEVKTSSRRVGYHQDIKRPSPF